jgi:hypothetical protein
MIYGGGMLRSKSLYTLVSCLMIASLLLSSSSSPVVAQEGNHQHLPLISGGTANSESVLLEGESLTLSAASIPVPTSYELLHHGAPSTPLEYRRRARD